MSKSLIYVVNNAETVGTANTAVALGNIVRRKGCAFRMNGTSISLVESGYYDIDVSATFTGSAAGDITLTVYQDGAPVSGATVTETVTTATTENISATIPGIVRVYCNSTSNISLVPLGTPVPTFSNIAVKVVKE